MEGYLTGSVTIIHPRDSSELSVDIDQFQEIEAWPLEVGEMPAITSGREMLLRQFRRIDPNGDFRILIRTTMDLDGGLSIYTRAVGCGIAYSDLSFGKDIQ